MYAHRLGAALGTQFTAVVLEIANQFLLLCVDRDCWLARGYCRLHRCVDVSELGIAIQVVAALTRLAIGLATVMQLTQQIGDHALARLETLRRQRLYQVALAAADPSQRRAGIAANRILDQLLKRCRQPRLVRHRTLAAGTSPTHTAAQVVATRSKLPNATVDAAARQTGRRRGRRYAAITLRLRLVGGEQPAASLVEKRGRSMPAPTHVVHVDHSHRLTYPYRLVPSSLSGSIPALCGAD